MSQAAVVLKPNVYVGVPAFAHIAVEESKQRSNAESQCQATGRRKTAKSCEIMNNRLLAKIRSVIGSLAVLGLALTHSVEGVESTAWESCRYAKDEKQARSIAELPTAASFEFFQRINGSSSAKCLPKKVQADPKPKLLEQEKGEGR
jgi:hypothetical protein